MSYVEMVKLFLSGDDDGFVEALSASPDRQLAVICLAWICGDVLKNNFEQTERFIRLSVGAAVAERFRQKLDEKRMRPPQPLASAEGLNGPFPWGGFTRDEEGNQVFDPKVVKAITESRE